MEIEHYAAANCSDGDIQLVGGSAENEGRVELCFNRAWGSVCGGYFSSTWDVSGAAVVCRQLGYLENGMQCSYYNIWGCTSSFLADHPNFFNENHDSLDVY